MKRFISKVSGALQAFASVALVMILTLCVHHGTLDLSEAFSLAIVPVAVVKLRKKKDEKHKEARAILDGVKEGKNLSEEEQKRFDAIMAEIEGIDSQIDREQRMADIEGSLEKPDPLGSVEDGNPESEPGDKPAPEARAGKDRKRKASMAFNTLRMLTSIANRNYSGVNEAQRELAKEGFYGEEAQQRAAGDYYSTIVSADGQVLLPTVVVEGIEEIGEVLGVARQLCTVFNHITGALKVPGATGTLRASAVAEGGAISAKKRAFQAVELNPLKWAIIVPWTYEIALEAGPQILADAQRAMARGFAYAEDDALFNGDGTGAYNSIDGILSANRSSVADYGLASGATSFDDLGADDVFLIRRKIPAALRSMASYAFHPDMEPKLRTLKDGNGRYIYAYNEDRGVATLGGRPVNYTEVLPSSDDDAVSTVFGVYGYFPAMKMAVGEGMTSEELREAAITDADDGSAINLATQDLRALKVREFFDMDMNFEEAFCTVTTAAS